MTKEKKIKAPSLRKQMRNQTIEQLITSLPILKEFLGKKEFDARVKKAAKLLTQGIKAKTTKEKKPKEN